MMDKWEFEIFVFSTHTGVYICIPDTKGEKLIPSIIGRP